MNIRHTTVTADDPETLDLYEQTRLERARTLRQRLYGHWFDLSGSVSALAVMARLGW